MGKKIGEGRPGLRKKMQQSLRPHVMGGYF